MDSLAHYQGCLQGDPGHLHTQDYLCGDSVSLDTVFVTNVTLGFLVFTLKPFDSII
jgi:hypothetical protein